MFFVYVLQSQKTGRFYIGQTDNFLIRFGQHMAGEVRSTSFRLPAKPAAAKPGSTGNPTNPPAVCQSCPALSGSR